MLPLLLPGDEVLVDPQAYRRSRPFVEDLVVLRSPSQWDLCLIKRVKSINQSGDCRIKWEFMMLFYECAISLELQI